MGLSHASIALRTIAKILTVPHPRPVQRIVQAWPDIEKWFWYILTQWITVGKAVSLGKFIMDGYKAVIPLLSVVATIPELRNVVLTEPARQMTLAVLIFCWTIESSELFVKESGYEPSISAALPLAALIANDIDPEPAAALDIFRVFAGLRTQAGSDYDPYNISQIALTFLRNHSPSLDLANAHMEILNLLGVAVPYSNALLAQHSIRDVTRLLSDLASKEYDSASAPELVQCITSCMQYLTKFMPTKDGFSNVRMALQAGLLPAIARCSSWVSEGTPAHDELVKALHIISLYIVYPSVLRPFLASVRKIERLNIADKTKPLYTSYMKLVRLVNVRIAMVAERCDYGEMFDLCVKCQNCDKSDDDAAFKACSGCFNLSYCSEACQKEDWEFHERECQKTQAIRKDGQPLIMSQEDADGILQFAMSQVNRNRAEIARVWKEEGPARTPLVSFDFTQDPLGVMVVGKRCLDTPPGRIAETGIYVPELKTVVDGRIYFRSLWLETIRVQSTTRTPSFACSCRKEIHRKGNGRLLESRSTT
ncbi:hypothetical protein B0H19DRAFT_1109975 [Mycena capillaripes]|nr:hypothetical protein B0H19DRAFT_1109975 [Mycena capillaripes]